jgi:AAA+ ATPase superfamily predicted ATPase
MIPENLRRLPNPYHITSHLYSRQFVGRENEIEKFKQILEKYRKTATLNNVIISGSKSIGKSTLLNRFIQLLENYNFIVYTVDIGRDPSIKINEFEFFKDLINELFEKYGQPDGDFFDNEQCEIWFSLTSNEYKHNSDFKDRKIRFATQYANYKKGIEEKISIKSIEKDFEEILGQIISKGMDSHGLAILIDEFQ